MSNFKLNNASISNILKSGATTVPNFSPITATTVPAGENMSLPYPTGFRIKTNNIVTDIANQYVANYTDYTTTTTSTAPTNAKHMRIIAIGGGGSGGGAGGDAYAKVNIMGGTASRQGGNGGNGSGGSYYTTPSDILLSNPNITIQIGSGGTAGNRGAYDETINNTGKANAQGGNGNTNNGNPTIITHNGITYTANGGLGGVGGKGGDASAYESGNSGGSNGASGTSYTQTTANVTTWPSIQAGNYGTGGTGGLNNGAGATAGKSGFARIIWLYQ